MADLPRRVISDGWTWVFPATLWISTRLNYGRPMVPPPPRIPRFTVDAPRENGPRADIASRDRAILEFGSSAGQALRASATEAIPLLGGQSTISGGVAIIGTPTERLAYIAGGRLSRDSGRRPDEDTLYDLASLTKVVATLPAVLRLVETGGGRPRCTSWHLYPGHPRSRDCLTERAIGAHTHLRTLRADWTVGRRWLARGTARARLPLNCR